MVLSSWPQTPSPDIPHEKDTQKWVLGQRDSNPLPVQSMANLGVGEQVRKKQENNYHRRQIRYYLWGAQRALTGERNKEGSGELTMGVSSSYTGVYFRTIWQIFPLCFMCVSAFM